MSNTADAASSRFPLVNAILCCVALVLTVVIGYVARQSRPDSTIEIHRGGSSFPASKLAFAKSTLGEKPVDQPKITNLQIVDFDSDGLNDVIACDAQRQQVIWYQQTSEGEWNPQPLGDALLAAPAHATVVDLDQDGDNDVLVSILGDVWPTDERVGAVVWLEQLDNMVFQRHALLDDLWRVTDIQAADFDSDGDLDLTVAVFGFMHGEVLWLENDGKQTFRDRRLMALPGAIHVPVADYDLDGDLDFATVLTQDEEEIWAFENKSVESGDESSPSRAELVPRMISFSHNFDLGGAGLVANDLDDDGDMDLILPAGDNLDLLQHYPQPYHGCILLENLGGWKFKRRRIATFGGAYAAAVGDLDADGDKDVVLVSVFNDWMDSKSASIVWLENDGSQNFTTWEIDKSPSHLVTVACGDINGDGADDIVAGSLHLMEPFNRLGRITMWLSGKGKP